MKYFVYMVECDDGYLYTGMTSDLPRRILQHRRNMSRITKNRGNPKLVYKESFDNRGEAAKREKEIKGWRREEKKKLFGVYPEE